MWTDKNDSNERTENEQYCVMSMSSTIWNTHTKRADNNCNRNRYEDQTYADSDQTDRKGNQKGLTLRLQQYLTLIQLSELTDQNRTPNTSEREKTLSLEIKLERAIFCSLGLFRALWNGLCYWFEGNWQFKLNTNLSCVCVGVQVQVEKNAERSWNVVTKQGSPFSFVHIGLFVLCFTVSVLTINCARKCLIDTQIMNLKDYKIFENIGRGREREREDGIEKTQETLSSLILFWDCQKLREGEGINVLVCAGTSSI